MSQGPKPFVFVLMPFSSDFDDVYKFGIKETAEEVGAYAERVDEQHFQGSILSRICNQIAKADVIVADMSQKNPNVFYEVGYAHALGKVTILLTQSSDDIPFDLKHWPHIVYGKSISQLKSQLFPRLTWALDERMGQQQTLKESWDLEVLLDDKPVPRSSEEAGPLWVWNAGSHMQLDFVIRNKGIMQSPTVSGLYIWLPVNDGKLMKHIAITNALIEWPSIEVPAPSPWLDGPVRQYRIDLPTEALPPSGFFMPPTKVIFRTPQHANDARRLRMMLRVVVAGIPEDYFVEVLLTAPEDGTLS